MTARTTRTCSSWRTRLRPDAALWSGSRPGALTCFLASHIGNEERLNALSRLLNSVGKASDGGPALLAISWSCEDERLASAARSTLSAAASTIAIQSYEAPKKLSQFEHYRRLAKATRTAPQQPEFIMFSDDDDVWSEQRHALYVHEASKAPANVQTLLCRRKTVMLSSATNDDEPQDADGVRALLSRKLARWTDCNLKDGLEESEHNMAEYFDMAVRFQVLLTFFERVPQCITHHRLCDLAFCFCFNKGTMGALGGTIRFMPSGKFADDFVYFYARGAKHGGASSISILPGEDEFGLATLKAAPQPVQRWFVWLEETHCMGGVAMCTHMMASIRQGIEQELIALRATGEVVPLQMVEGACKHQGRLTLQSLDIDYPNFGFLSTDLVEWCGALADGAIRARVLSAFEFEALVCMKTWRVALRVEPSEAATQRNGKERATTHRDRSDAQILEEECDIPRGAPPGHPGKRVGLWNTLGGWRVPPRLLQ